MNSKKNYPQKIYSNEAEYGLVEDSLKMHRSGSNETALVSKIPHITNDKNVIMTPGQGKNNNFNFTWWIF